LLSQKRTKLNSRETLSYRRTQPKRSYPSSRLSGYDYRKAKTIREKENAFKDATRRHAMLKELQEKKYPFPNSDLSGIINDLLENEIIQLSEPKRLK